MSYSSTFFGRITSIKTEEAIYNVNYLQTLPKRNDKFHYFIREMFSNNSQHAAQDISIGFARSYKNVDYNNWLPEFEKLILNLKWTSIAVIVESAYEGTKRYEWFNKKGRTESNYTDLGYIEEENWFFGRGHKNYVELYGVENKGNETEEIVVIEEFINALKKNKIKHAELELIQSTQQNELILKSSNLGIKHFTIELLEAYVKYYQIRKTKGHKSGFNNMDSIIVEIDMLNLFNSKSTIRIKQIHIHHKPSIKNWMYQFVHNVKRKLKTISNSR